MPENVETDCKSNQNDRKDGEDRDESDQNLKRGNVTKHLKAEACLGEHWYVSFKSCKSRVLLEEEEELCPGEEDHESSQVTRRVAVEQTERRRNLCEAICQTWSERRGEMLSREERQHRWHCPSWCTWTSESSSAWAPGESSREPWLPRPESEHEIQPGLWRSQGWAEGCLQKHTWHFSSSSWWDFCDICSPRFWSRTDLVNISYRDTNLVAK